MVGLGILIPVLGLILNADIGSEYPALQPYLHALGNPTHLQLVMWAILILVLIYLIKAFFFIFLNWRQTEFSTSLTADLSSKLLLGYLRQPYTFHLQRNSAELIRNISVEVPQFGTLSAAIINLTIELSIISGMAVLLVYTEPVGALSVILFFGVSGFAFQQFTRHFTYSLGNKRQYHSLLSFKHLSQSLSGAKDVKLLGRELYFLEEYRYHIKASFNILMKSQLLSIIPRAYLEFLAVCGLSGLIFLMVLQGKPLDQLVPTIGIFVAAAFRMIPSVNKLMISLQTIRFSRPVVETLYHEFSMIKLSENNIKISPEKFQFLDKIEINNLNFTYPSSSSKSLNGVSLTIKKGATIGIIGTSGSGKSTLIDSILGLLVPDSGEILVDNRDIKYNLRSWQNLIGYVPQTIYLIDDTIRKNVAFGIEESQIDDSAVEQAIKAAQLDLFVNDLSEGLNTYVGERGVRISGGQRQRIGIARALYHDPLILVLDEATSALDSITEREVMSAVNTLKGDKTVLIVAHRLSTLENCTKIYKLHRGQVVEQYSTYENLLK